MFKKRNTSLIAKVALTIALFLVAYVSYVFFQQMQNLEKSVTEMSHSSQRLMEYEQILSILSVNEGSMRSFIITKDSSYIKKRFYKKETLIPLLHELSLSDKNTDNITKDDSLNILVNLRFLVFEQALSVSKDV